MIFGTLLGVTVTIFIMTSSSSSVHANNLRVVFNNGNAPNSAAFCSEPEYVAIDNIMSTFKPYRHLHEISMDETASIDQNQTSSLVYDDVNTTAVDRELYPAYCADVCAGCVPKTCRSAKCVGYRRNRALEDGSNDIHDRNLQILTGPCFSLISQVHLRLDGLAPRLSSPCRNFIIFGRQVQCISNTIYGGITGLKVDSALNGMILSSSIPTSGWSVCRSHQALAVQALVNECVQYVRLEVSGAGGSFWTNDNYAPFTMQIPLNGIGPYTVKVTPNNLPGNAKTWTFNVNGC
jgi:hypothetical protein